MQSLNRLFSLACLALISLSSFAADLVLQPVRVAPDVYAIVGDLDGQSYANDGLNSNLGFVVGADGVLVINAGPSTRVARALHAAIQKITPKPIRWVVNLNSQSHNWLGNEYFKQRGVTILAQTSASKLMQELGAGQLQAAQGVLKDKAAGTALAYPSETIDTQRTLQLGKTKIELLHFGSAHTAGDIIVWLPQQKILFAGDLVFTQRMLAVLPLGNSGGWVKAFDQALALKPLIIVPGHGKLTDIKTATHDTRDYLMTLRNGAQAVLAKNGSLQDAVAKTDQSKFTYLLNFELLAKRNMNQVFTEMERESF